MTKMKESVERPSIEIGERLRKLREEHKLTQSELAKYLGVGRSTVTRWEGGTAYPKNQLERLSKLYGVTMDYIYTGKQEKPVKGNRIPVLGRVAAGIPIEAIQEIEDWEEIPESWGDPREYFALRIKGHSMEPHLLPGDTIIVHKQEDIDSGKVAVVLINGNEGTVKQVKKIPEGIILVGYNAAVYEPHFYSNEEILSLPVRIAGVVVESRHKW